ncbi:hypothetical protein [Amycolatopsis dongchuanensis]|uniref:Uncharacterized protein n=1 Tax=Amycolatopsis dongchuanensis TaxID=1070866 RepID=A0ABP9Q271_9PSEU
MSDFVEISLGTLRAAFEQVMTHFQETEGDVVRLKADYFWSIPDDDIYDVTRDPGKLTIGQITESYEQLVSLVGDSDRRVTWEGVWLSEVLRAVATPRTRKS